MAGRGAESHLPMVNEDNFIPGYAGASENTTTTWKHAQKTGKKYVDPHYQGAKQAYSGDKYAGAPWDEYSLLTPWGTPNVLLNTEISALWGVRYWWTHMSLAVLYTVSWVVMVAFYASTRDISQCVHITEDMLSKVNTSFVNETDTDEVFFAQVLVPAENNVAKLDLFWLLLWPSLFMSLVHGILMWPTVFEAWYEVYVKNEQAAIKYLAVAVPWAFIVMTLATIVGVTDIFILVLLAVMAVVSQTAIGYMEWFNANGAKVRKAGYFTIVGGLMETGMSKEVAEALAKPAVLAELAWSPLIAAVFAEVTIFAILVTNFAHAVDEGSSTVQWWVYGAGITYIVSKGLQLLQAVGYWSNWGFFSIYLWNELAYTVGTFIVYMLITWLILGGAGKRERGDSCIYLGWA